MAYSISGKTAPVKKTTTTTGSGGTVTGKTTSDDDGDEIKIGTVTKKFGSLEINCEMDGTLYINNKQIGEVTEGSIIPIEKLKVGSHIVKIIHADGDFAETVNIEFNRKTIITAKGRKKNEVILPGHSNEMIFIQGGTFDMGDNFGDGRDDEKPVHTVTVSDFYMSKYEVTVGMFKQFIDETAYQADADKDGGSYIWNGKEWKKTSGVNWKCDAEGNIRSSSEYDHPVIHVSWNDAKAFCSWLSKKTGKNYRLPYEAEWEYAVRSGGKKYKYSWGNSEPNGMQCNFADANTSFDWSTKSANDGYKYTAPVGKYPANESGLCDMTGNVWEWCEDWYDGSYYKNSPAVNPKGPNSGTHRVLRGGSWYDGPSYLRASYRISIIPAGRISDYGFRLSRTE